MTVASAALLSPGSFGLVIPKVGVLDLEHKDKWDKAFEVWSDEYGPATSPWLRAFSPVALAKKLHAGSSVPQFLVLTGKNDSRVSALHSYSFTEEILEKTKTSDNVDLWAVNNAGHSVYSVPYQGLIGWRTKTVEWAFIFDYLGLAF